jgi:hypothetical protein
MLTEDMRIVAGLQEAKTVENPLPKLLEAEKQQILRERQRIIDEQKTVTTHFTIFQERMERYQEMIQTVSALFTPENTKEFVGGLYESKYAQLQKFADVVINDDLSTAMSYLDENYYVIKTELDRIGRLNEAIEESNAPTYFVAEPLVTYDSEHNLNIPVFKYQTLEEKVASEIPYGAEIIQLSENLSIVRHSGKKYYSRFTTEQLTMLEKKGFLI